MLRRHQIIPAETLREIAEQVGPGVTKRRYLAFWACPILVVVFFAVVVIRKLVIGVGLHFDAVERLLWPLNLTLMSVGAFMMWRSSRAIRLKRVRSVMLQHRRCPHCGYDLRALPADPGDHATACPECGSAWKLPDWRRSDFEPTD